MWQWILKCDTKTQATTTKIDKLHFIKIKINFYASMYIIMKMKRHSEGGKKKNNLMCPWICIDVPCCMHT